MVRTRVLATVRGVSSALTVVTKSAPVTFKRLSPLSVRKLSSFSSGGASLLDSSVLSSGLAASTIQAYLSVCMLLLASVLQTLASVRLAQRNAPFSPLSPPTAAC